MQTMEVDTRQRAAQEHQVEMESLKAEFTAVQSRLAEAEQWASAHAEAESLRSEMASLQARLEESEQQAEAREDSFKAEVALLQSQLMQAEGQAGAGEEGEALREQVASLQARLEESEHEAAMKEVRLKSEILSLQNQLTEAADWGLSDRENLALRMELDSVQATLVEMRIEKDATMASLKAELQNLYQDSAQTELLREQVCSAGSFVSDDCLKRREGSSFSCLYESILC